MRNKRTNCLVGIALVALLLPLALMGATYPRNHVRAGFRGSLSKSLAGRQTGTGAQALASTVDLIPYFADGVSVGNFASTTTPWDEISGICRNQRAENTGYAWMNSDQVSSPFVIRAVRLSDAADGGIWTLTGATGVDVEDIASATVGVQPYIYVADIGDNGHVHSTVSIYRVKEPIITGSSGSLAAGTDYENIVCQYPASPVGESSSTGPRDAESLIVDPDTGDMYVLTKRTTQIQVFKLAHATSYTGTQTFTYMGDMYQLANSENPNSPGNGGRAVAADCSPDGKELLVKNYSDMYLFNRDKTSQTIYQALAGTPTRIAGYVGGKNPSSYPNSEPQGEGCCFASDGVAIYTAGEYSQNYATGKGYNSFLGLYPLFKYNRLTNFPTEVSFQYGVSSYTGTSDTYLYSLTTGAPAANTVIRGTEITFVVDWNVTSTDERYGLLKFDLSSIPSTATIVGCDLQLFINTEGSIFKMYKMLEAWSETTTHATLGHLPAFNGVQAASTPDCTIGDYTLLVTGAGGIDSIVIKIPVATIQAWVNGSVTNNGWVLYGVSTTDEHSATGNGFQFRSREAVTAADRPKLTVRYTP